MLKKPMSSILENKDFKELIDAIKKINEKLEDILNKNQEVNKKIK